MQGDVGALGQVVRDQGGQADAEVDVVAVAQFAARRARPSRRGSSSSDRLRAPDRVRCRRPSGSGSVVRFSMSLRAACSGVSSTTRWTKMPGRWISSGCSLADLDDPFGLDDGEPPGHRRRWVEVACGGVEHAVAGLVGDGRADQRVVGDDRLLEHHLPAAEGADFLRRRRQRDGCRPGGSATAGRPRRPACRRRSG